MGKKTGKRIALWVAPGVVGGIVIGMQPGQICLQYLQAYWELFSSL